MLQEFLQDGEDFGTSQYESFMPWLGKGRSVKGPIQDGAHATHSRHQEMVIHDEQDVSVDTCGESLDPANHGAHFPMPVRLLDQEIGLWLLAAHERGTHAP
jgi:hypothetical protein